MADIFFSEILCKKVFDISTRKVGKVIDFVVSIDDSSPPILQSVLIKSGRRLFEAQAVDIIKMNANEGIEIKAFTPAVQTTAMINEYYIRQDLLDRQMLNSISRSISRINDVSLNNDTVWKINSIDISIYGLGSRLGFKKFSPNKRQIVPWEAVEIFGCDLPTPIKFSHKKFAEMHPADIADIIIQLSYPQGHEVIFSLPIDIAAAALQTLDISMRTAAVAAMQLDKAAEILSYMSPDDSVDILNGLPPENAALLLSKMDIAKVEQVSELLSYPTNSAGGRMATDFLTFAQNQTVLEAINMIRESDTLPNTMNYLYITDRIGSKKLRGAVSLRQLVHAQPEVKFEEIMITKLQVKYLDSNIDEVARTMSHYNLIALPIVNENIEIMGVVTVDDAMAHLLPDAWKTKVPRFFS